MNFVTGGTGIVGSQLILDLLKKGEEVVAMKREKSNLEHIQNLFDWQGASALFQQVKWVDGDITDINSLLAALKGINRIFHCAALVSFDPRDKKAMERANVVGTSNVVNAALQAKVDELVYVSSTAAIGSQKKGTSIDEKCTWDSGLKNSFYSFTKYMAELEVWRGAEEGLQVTIVNPGVIIGPGQWGKSSTNVFTTVWKGLKFYSPGSNAFVDVRDVCTAMIALSDKKIFNERFLLIGENIAFKRFFEMISNAIGKNPPHIGINRLVANIAWRLNRISSAISGSKPLITNETTRAAFSRQVYSNEKIKAVLKFEFIPIQESVEYTGKLFVQSR